MNHPSSLVSIMQSNFPVSGSNDTEDGDWISFTISTDCDFSVLLKAAVCTIVESTCTAADRRQLKTFRSEVKLKTSLQAATISAETIIDWCIVLTAL